VITPIRLDDRSIAAIAAIAAELLDGRTTDPDLIDAAEVARRFGVSRDYVYRHADELGVIRLGVGPRPRKRFAPATVRAWFEHRVVGDAEPERQRVSRRAVRRVRSVELLPVKGE